jgi:hypothetical protein
MNELINLGNGQFVKVTMLKGEKGSNIATITKTNTSGLVDTYTVTLTDGSTTTFEVTNGKTILSVVKTGTSGLVDTYTITYNDNTTSTFTVTNGRGIERIDKTWTSGLVDTYTITYNDGTTSTFDVTNGNAESLQDAIKASSCAIKAGVSQVEFTQLGNAYITYIPNSECVENAIVVVCFDNGSMYKGTLNYSSTIGRWGISDVSLIQGSDVPATWNVGYGNDSVGTRAFRTGTDFVFSSGVGIALSTSSNVVSYYCVLSSGKVSDNYLQTEIDQKVSKSGDTITGFIHMDNSSSESPRLYFNSSTGFNYLENEGNGSLRIRGSDDLLAHISKDSFVMNDSANLVYSRKINPTSGLSWKNAPEYAETTYYYEGADTTTLDLPHRYCFVTVRKTLSSRGVAIAYSWNDGTDGQWWINRCHDTWRGWHRMPYMTTSGTTLNINI